MFRLISEKQFDGFGPCGQSGHGQPQALELVLPARKAAIRKLLRRDCPREPGVYGMIDAQGKLIYVGKSKCLRERLLSYLSRKADPKAQRIIGAARRLVLEPAPQEFTALLRELELIRRCCPRFNVKGHPGRLRRGYIILGRSPAPFAYVAEQPSGRDRLAVGPLRPSRTLRRMVRTLNDFFQLRDCAKRGLPVYRDQIQSVGPAPPARSASPAPPARRGGGPTAAGTAGPTCDLHGCLRHELGTCLGPCCGACSSRKYAERVRAAAAFLRGADLSALDRLDRAMRAAAAAEHFERAASVRDTLASLGDLHAMLEQMRTVRQTYSFVYPLPSYAGDPTWYFIHQGQVIAAAPAPVNRRTARECLKVLDRAYPDGTPKSHQELPEDPDLVLIVSAWFRENPEEIRKTMAPDEARQRCLARVAAAARSA